MREWNLAAGDPLSLTIAADARLDPVDYTNDQIWELVIGSGEPPTLAIQTTFGLRARSMRIFPIFTQMNTTRFNPESFYQPPRVTRFLANYLCVAYSPFSGIDVMSEYWVPGSQVLACRTSVTNSSVIPVHLVLEWAALLAPLGEGLGMSYTQDQKVNILTGHTSNLEPVFYLAGNPQISSGPFPTLGIYLELEPGNVRQVCWAQASLDSRQSSVDLAVQTLVRPWDTEIARLDMSNATQAVEIETGDPDWDAAFAFSQKTAFSLLMGPSAGLPYPSFVLSRQPDQGYSQRGDGTDFSRLWDGQSPLDTYFLSSLILPGAARFVQNMIRNFLSTQAEDGQMDGKPGLAGQRARFQAAPLLAAIAWKTFQCSQDEGFLNEVLPGLMRYIEAWFLPEHDRDGDGFPEWDLPVQSGLEENPIFDRWHATRPTHDISSFESPGLAACLYNEIQALSRIARQVGQVGTVRALIARAGILRKAVESAWHPGQAIYHYRDRDTHLSHKGALVMQSTGPGEILLNHIFKEPRRLLVHLSAQGESPPSASIIIRGAAPSGPCIEEISTKSLVWVASQTSLSTRNVFTAVERIEIKDVASVDEVSIFTMDFSQEDITLLLPLWAQITHPRRAENLIKKTILNPDRFLLPFGLPACPISPLNSSSAGQNLCPQIYIIWNQLIVEGLLNYGFRAEAADLFARLMSGILPALKTHQGFYHSYHAQTGEASGERNILDSLAPVGLFLDILGIQLISAHSVIITESNPFSWPVTVKYRGLKVIRQNKQTQVIFPDGQKVNVTGAGKHWVSLTADKQKAG